MKRNTRKFRLVLTTLTLVALVFSVFGAVPAWTAGTTYTATFTYADPSGNDWGYSGTGSLVRPDGCWGDRIEDLSGNAITGAGTWSSGYIGSGIGAHSLHEVIQGWYQGMDGYSDAWTTDTSVPPSGRSTTFASHIYDDPITDASYGGSDYRPTETDSGFIENLWKFESVDTNADGYRLTVKANDLDNYYEQKTKKGYPYTGAEDWYVKAKYDGTVHDLGMMPIAPDDTNGWDSEVTFMLPGFTGGDIIIGIDGTYWNAISKNVGTDGSHRPDSTDPDPDGKHAGSGHQHGIRLSELTLTPLPATVWVDDSYSTSYCPAGTTWATTCFATIGTALAAVGDWGTIYVGSGTYDEALDITKNVTLIGYGGPVITGGAVTTVHDIIKVDGDYTVNIKGFTLDRVTASSASPNTGIYYLHGASGTIEGNTIRHIEGNRGYGILLGGGLGGTACDDNADIGVGTVTVRNNTTGGTTAATAIGRVGIEVKCPSSGTVIVEDNEVIGSYDAIPFLSYGITAYGGADPIIRNNNVHHHTHPVDMWGSGGMACGDYGVTGNGCDATIENNYIHDNETGIYVGTLYYSGTYDYSSPTIKYNRIEGSEWGINIEGGASPNITNNTITGASGVGIDIGDYNGTANSGASSSVQNNTFSGLDSAVVISDTGTGGTTYTFTSNDFAGNTVGFTNNYTFTTDINAENNWWGATTGPATGYITGTQASKVDYAPWSEALMGGVAASTHAVGETSTFDVKVTADDVYGVQFIVDYDTAPIDYSAHTKTDNPFFWDYVVWDGSRNDGAGTVKFSGSHQLDSHPNPADLTNNEVADVTFECKFQGTSSITFDQARLSDIDGYEIPSTWVGDSVVCTAEEHTVTGQMKLQSRYSGSYDGTVEAFVPGGYTDTSAGDGSFSITVPDGIGYTVSFEMPRFLDHVVTGLTISGDYDFGTIGLRGGDTNDDDIINIQDLSTIGGVFGTSPGTGSNADINYDGDVNILDLAVAGGNFGRTSPVLW